MYKQRDIILIPIPFTDLSSNKKRPVVVISNDDYNLSSNDIIVIAITSNIEFSNDYCIPIDNSNLENGILPKKSIVRCDKIYTLSKDIIIKKFNKINFETFNLIQNKIDNLINTGNV